VAVRIFIIDLRNELYGPKPDWPLRIDVDRERPVAARLMKEVSRERPIETSASGRAAT